MTITVYVPEATAIVNGLHYVVWQDGSWEEMNQPEEGEPITLGVIAGGPKLTEDQLDSLSFLIANLMVANRIHIDQVGAGFLHMGQAVDTPLCMQTIRSRSLHRLLEVWPGPSGLVPEA